MEKIKAHAEINCFIETFDETALNAAEQIDLKIKKGETGKLAGMVLAIKDNILYKGHLCTASSKILEGFKAPYTATALERLLREDAIVIGRTSCDEFAMGSSNETSIYGHVLNPLDNLRVPGGSSGGSAAAVAAGLCDVALGSDTGGSIRQPAAFCGIYGLKPTYGVVSRYGLIAYGSSFDQIGPLTTNTLDAELLLDIMSGFDPKDATSNSTYSYKNWEVENLSHVSIGFYPEILQSEFLGHEVKLAYEKALNFLKEAGAHLKEFDFPFKDQLVPVYYILSTAEASSNLARFDGIRYGFRENIHDDLELMQIKTRTKGFGKEVKRRILLGTFVLSSGFYEAYYSKAQKARRLIKDLLEKQLKIAQAILLPTTPDLPFRFGERSDDPVKMYMEDQFTVLSNLTGHPALSFPVFVQSFPVGIQIIGPNFEEAFLLSLAEKLRPLSVGLSNN